MRKKVLARALALFMAISLLSTTALAASFSELQDAIDGIEGADLGEGRFGYAHNAETDTYGIEAWDDNGTRNVQLNENVEREDGDLTVYVEGNITLNLNGHDIDANGLGGVLGVLGANLTVNGADAAGNMGSITGGNNTDNGYEDFGYGGGLDILYSDVTLNNVKVTNNTAQYGGGGLRVQEGSNVTINGGEVSNNTAGYAGAISVIGDNEYDETSTITIDGSKIIGNTANGKGGDPDEQHSGNGGGIIVEVNSNATISNTEFANNTANHAGGAINIYDNASVTITGSNIHDNHANGDFGGGAIIVDGKDDPNGVSVAIKGTAITDNTTAQFGGAINAKDSSVSVENSTITGNTAGTNGGGIFGENAAFEVTDSNISNNTAGTNGGGIFGENTAFEVTDSNISNNTAGVSGADIVGVGGSKITMENDKSVGETLNDDGEEITGWYEDGTDNRWSADNYTEAGTSYDGTSDFALKAAHGAVSPDNPGPDEPGTDEPGTDEPGTDEPGTDEPDDPVIVIPTPDVPLAPAPGGDTDTVEIVDEEVPLAGTVGLNDVEHFAYIIGYDNGTVRPLDNLTRAEAVTIFFRLMTDEYRTANWSTTNTFADVNAGNWYNNAISTCQKAGALAAFDQDTNFLPNQAITRAEFAALAAGFISDEYTGETVGDFSDTEGHWAAGYIRKAVEAGWITGDGNTFRPDELITRADVMIMVNRMLDRVPDADHMLPNMITWIDNPEGTSYYADVQEATNEHDYERDEMGITETWTELKSPRDWKALEEEWAANSGSSASETVEGETR